MGGSRMITASAGAIALATISEGEDELLQGEPEVIGIDLAAGPDFTLFRECPEVDIRPLKYHQLHNGHPRSFRKAR